MMTGAGLPSSATVEGERLNDNGNDSDFYCFRGQDFLSVPPEFAELAIHGEEIAVAAVGPGRRAEQGGIENDNETQESLGGGVNQSGRKKQSSEWLVEGTKINANGDCPIAIFLPFTRQDNIAVHEPRDWPVYDTSPSTPMATSQLVAAAMALKHFNNRDGSVVPELASDPLMANCSIRFPLKNSTTVVDTRYNPIAISQFFAKDPSARKLCSMVGLYYNVPATIGGSLSAGYNIPMVSHGAETSLLTTEMRAPLTARINVNYHPMGEAIVSALLHMGRTDFLATVFSADKDAESAITTVGNAAKKKGFRFITNERIFETKPSHEIGSAWHALKNIKEKTYRTIVVSLLDTQLHLPLVADAAEELGMNGNDYFWVFANNADMNYLASSKNSNVTKLAQGVGVVRQLDGFMFNGEADPFLKSWRSQGSEMAELVRSLNPIEEEQPGYFNVTDEYFQMAEPQMGSAFLYDAVVATGIGACRAEAEAQTPTFEGQVGGVDGEQKKRGNRGKSEAEESETGGRLLGKTMKEYYRQIIRSSSATTKRAIRHKQQRRKAQKAKARKGFTRNPHLMGIVSSDFAGATGAVKFESGRNFKSRDRDFVTFGLYNIRQERGGEGSKLEYVLTDILHGGSSSGNWTETKHGPFLFHDGTPSPPELLRDVPEQNYLSRGVHVSGLILMSIALTLIVASVIFVSLKRKHAVVRAAQPPFLLLLQFGAIILTFSILTMSFDESFGWTEAMLDAACQATPWLITLGYIIIYCAIFSKLWRINKVLQFRKGSSVGIKQALAPFAAFIVAAVVILAVWTGVDPYTWVRREVNSDTNETYGQCESQHFLAFAIPLLLIMVSATIFAAAMAHRTKDIDEKYAESTWIFYTIFLQLQVLMVGVPVIVILKDASADGSYLGRVLVVWTIPMTTIILLVGPKAKKVFYPDEATKKTRGASKGVKVSGLHISRGSSLLGPSVKSGGGSLLGISVRSGGASEAVSTVPSSQQTSTVNCFTNSHLFTDENVDCPSKDDGRASARSQKTISENCDEEAKQEEQAPDSNKFVEK